MSDVLFRLRAVVSRNRLQRELDEEVAFHLEMESRKYIERGMDEAEARRQARRNFGGVEVQKEWARDVWGVRLVQELKSDARYALRQLRRSPLFSVVAVLTLALGIGGATAIFSLVHGVLLKPLPFDRPEELVAVWHTDPSRGIERYHQSGATYLTYREENRVFEDIGIWGSFPLSVTEVAEPERVDAIAVTDGVFSALRVRPIVGRLFAREDMDVGSPYTVVLGYGYWQERFGGEPGAIGRTLRINGVPAEIIGVMPQDFRLRAYDPSIYFPLRFDPARTRMGGGFGFEAIARLRPGVTLEDADRDIARMLPLTVEKFPNPTFPLAKLEEWGLAPNVIPLQEDMVGDIGSLLWVLLSAVGLVLLIACVNVVNLFLVKAEGRRREVAVRAALGGRRGRIARQLVHEGMVLGLGAGAVALALAAAALGLVLRLAPTDLPRINEIGIGPVELLVTFGLAVLVGMLFGLIPTLYHGETELIARLKAGGRSISEGRRRVRVRNVLAAAQVAVALVVLVGSGLMLRTFQELRSVQPGFERPEELLTFRLTVPAADVPDPAAVASFHEQTLDRLRQIPGVESVGAVSAVALDDRSPSYATYVEGVFTPENEFPPSRRYKWVAGSYFETMGNRLIAGRVITADDVRARARVVMVTANFAREYWAEPSLAVGKRIRHTPGEPWAEIVGVVGDVRDDGVAQPPTPIVYWPLIVETFDGADLYVRRTMAFVLRSTRAASTLLPEVREAVWSLNPNLPLAGAGTLDRLFDRSMARTSFMLVVLGVAGASALLLALVGVYGVIAYVVSQRTREIGVRMALGATRKNVRLSVVRQGGLIAGAGLIVGLVVAVATTRLMAALLFGVSPVDLLTYGAVCVGLGCVVLLASYFPARRAASVDPAQTLRWE